MIAIATSLVALVLTVAQPPPAQAPPPVTPATDRAAPVGLPPALEQEARAIERLVIAPCCWMQPVSDHQSPASDEVKQQIRVWLSAGRTRQQVLDGFVEQYGVRVLAEPPNRGFSRFLYFTPIAVFVVSALGLIVFVRRWTGRKAGQRTLELGHSVHEQRGLRRASPAAVLGDPNGQIRAVIVCSRARTTAR